MSTYKEKADNYIKIVKKQMESIGVLEEVDKENLELLRAQVSLYYQALEELDTNGLIVTGAKGRMPNPAFSIERSAIQNITSLLRELSISARQRRFLTRDEIINEEDPMDEFLSKMQQGEDLV